MIQNISTKKVFTPILKEYDTEFFLFIYLRVKVKV